MCPFEGDRLCGLLSSLPACSFFENHSTSHSTLSTSWGPQYYSTVLPVPCLLGMGGAIDDDRSLSSRIAHPNDFKLDTALSRVLGNKPAECEVDRTNGCRENRIELECRSKSCHHVHKNVSVLCLCPGLSNNSASPWQPLKSGPFLLQRAPLVSVGRRAGS